MLVNLWRLHDCVAILPLIVRVFHNVQYRRRVLPLLRCLLPYLHWQFESYPDCCIASGGLNASGCSVPLFTPGPWRHLNHPYENQGYSLALIII